MGRGKAKGEMIVYLVCVVRNETYVYGSVLPNMRGVAQNRRIRTSVVNRPIALVYLPQTFQKTTHRACLALGLDTYLYKVAPKFSPTLHSYIPVYK